MDNHFLFSLITALFVGAISGYLGSLMVSKRMALAGDALGHVALPGMGLALLLGFNVTFGALIFLVIGIFLIWILEGRTELPTETLVGVVFVLSLALGFIITPEPELLHALIGDISSIAYVDAVIAVVFSAVIFWLAYKVYSKIILIWISEELAAAEKINIKKYNLIYLLLVAGVVALGIKITGSLLVGALVIVPAASSRNFSRNLKEYSYLSIFIGAMSSALGVMLYNSLKLPCGPLIILINIFIFFISLIFKSRG